MPSRRAHLAPSAAQSKLTAALAALRAELGLPDGFPQDALAEAATAHAVEPGLDLRDIPFATLDPAGSMDLDQAFQLERAASGGGWRVRYAIADVPAFVAPLGALDRVARQRGQTLYAADGTIPLHPPVLSEDRVSLLPDEDRTAYVWTFDLDDRGAVVESRVERAVVRSRAKLDYASVQAALDRDGADSPAALLPEIGRARIEQERLRGGASLDLPDEEIVRTPDGAYRIERRTPLPVEDWNAQLSLMTGMAAAQLMLAGGVGVLRTMPPPADTTLDAFRIRVAALGRPWAEGVPYGEYLRRLDRTDPMSLAVMQAAASLFRGAGYTVFDGTAPTATAQAAVAAPYAHVTAPLRRLVDRWGLVICAALSAGAPAPEWARTSLPGVPALMEASARRASELDRASIDRVEAALLSDRVGETFEATVIELRGERALFQLVDPAVTSGCVAPPGTRPGAQLAVRLDAADIPTGKVEFTAIG